MSTTAPVTVESVAMTPLEKRASFSLAAIFALRMLGLFLVLPVFVLEARHYPGGDNTALVGLAMGVYGLTQALMQVPLGMASDRWGRKRIIVLGLGVFALGSGVAALATSVEGLLVGRALQGAGAVSAAVTARLADQTRDSVRTKGMALIGASIGLMFALSLVLAPPLTAAVGLGGVFALTLILAVAGIAVVTWWTPPRAPQSAQRPARQADGRVVSPFPLAAESGRVRSARHTTGHVDGGARAADADRLGPGQPLAGVSARSIGLVCTDGRPVCHGTTGLFACRVARRRAAAVTGARWLVAGRVQRAGTVATGNAAVFVFRELQHP